jgi:hypothetical protein
MSTGSSVSCASPTPTRSSHMTSAYTLLRRLQLTKPFTHLRALLFDNCCGYRRGGTACRLGTISTSTVPFSGMENLSRHELTRNTKEFDHERLLVTVILGSLSELHWPFLDMKIMVWYKSNTGLHISSYLCQWWRTCV